MLTKGLKILDATAIDIFELNFSQSDEKIRSNYRRADFSSEGVLKDDSLDIYITTFSAVYNF